MGSPARLLAKSSMPGPPKPEELVAVVDEGPAEGEAEEEQGDGWWGRRCCLRAAGPRGAGGGGWSLGGSVN